MRPIDADNFLKEIDSVELVGKVFYKGIDDAIESICATVKYRLIDAPTVDAVPVVRCKDCKYHISNNCYASNLTRNSNIKLGVFTGDDYFCADGERKTE